MDKGQSSKKTHNMPGPARIVQAALHKRAKGKESAEEEVLPTQEYIARAMVEPQFDDSFTKTPWECVRSFGYLDMDCYSPIHTIVAHSRRCDYKRMSKESQKPTPTSSCLLVNNSKCDRINLAICIFSHCN